MATNHDHEVIIDASDVVVAHKFVFVLQEQEILWLIVQWIIR
jgi:hypothetical protein